MAVRGMGLLLVLPPTENLPSMQGRSNGRSIPFAYYVNRRLPS
jgi:hypothetical protein